MDILALLLVPLVGFAVLGAILGVPLVSARLAMAWDGAWRLLAALPAAAFGFVLARLIIDTSRDPTSHNLWPFEFAYVVLPAIPWLAVLILVRRSRGLPVPPLLAWRLPGGERREWNVGMDWRAALEAPSPRLRTGAGILGGWLMLQALGALTAGGASKAGAGAMVVALALLWLAVVGRWPAWFSMGRRWGRRR